MFVPSAGWCRNRRTKDAKCAVQCPKHLVALRADPRSWVSIESQRREEDPRIAPRVHHHRLTVRHQRTSRCPAGGPPAARVPSRLDTDGIAGVRRASDRQLLVAALHLRMMALDVLTGRRDQSVVVLRLMTTRAIDRSHLAFFVHSPAEQRRSCPRPAASSQARRLGRRRPRLRPSLARSFSAGGFHQQGRSRPRCQSRGVSGRGGGWAEWPHQRRRRPVS